MLRWFLFVPALVVLGCGPDDGPWGEQSETTAVPESTPRGDRPVVVPSNRGDEVADGFRGEVHPVLHGRSRLEVTAHWSPIPKGRAYELGYFPEPYYQPFRGLTIRKPREVYTERAFSGFLPQEVGSVGQIWALDKERVAGFLHQFHPRTRLTLSAAGRLGGPNGAFGILRAVSSTHLDILFRVHAEVEPRPGVWFTPAQFAGRLLVNRAAGTVEHFRLALPTEKSLNATLTVRRPAEALIDIVHVERMELTGGNDPLPGKADWTAALDEAEARRRLKEVFYPFSGIDWIPFERAQVEARRRDKPILAVVTWGGLDDQSC